MKQPHSFAKNIFTYFLIFISTAYLSLLSHGFGTHTFVHMADNSIEEIGMLCRRVLDKKLAVISYDTATETFTNAPIKRCGTSTTHRYVQFCFDGSLARESTNRIICTPTQEFYSPTSHSWVPAYQLQAGDALLCKQGIKIIADSAYVRQSLEIYTLQIQNTHTFFVGYHGALTHNMVIPAALGLGFSIPFGSAAGSAAGSFFGPVTLVAGAVLGSAIDAFVSMVQSDSVPSYKVDLGNTHYIDNFIHQRGESDAGGNKISEQNSNFISPIPDGPKMDDDKNKTAQLPEHSNKQKMNHIFNASKPGHRAFSEELYNQMNNLVKDPKNYLGPDKYNNQWFGKMLENGEQIWAKAQAGEVISAGINSQPIPHNPMTGMSKIKPPMRK